MRALLLALALSASAAEPDSRPRLLLETDAGDLVLRLEPSAAPKRVARVLARARAGGYDGAAFYRATDLFAQLGSATAARRGRALPPEPGALKHRRGVVTAARDPARPDDADALAFLFADAPALDGKLTAVGEITAGLEVLDALRGAPRGEDGKLLAPIVVRRATSLAPGDSPALRPVPREMLHTRGLPPAAGKWGALAALAALALYLAAVSAKAVAVARTALLVLLGAWTVAFAGYAPTAQHGRWTGIALLLSAIAVFRLMSGFETREAPR